MKNTFLAVTFSPMMLQSGKSARVEEISLDQANDLLSSGKWQSAVGHAVTAAVLTVLLGREVPFARVNLSLDSGDRLVCIIPGFRASEAREFTKEEVESAGNRAFLVTIG